ncbi:MAG: TetR/AcrR family transcriptional regulator [bacterium]|nr:TetR/AcrR family transcriptional regulator [bacterium]MDE0288000.1 TetR/AcrR family transcriptional regulator [bacterium]
MSDPTDTHTADSGRPRRRADPEATTARLLEAAATEFVEYGYEAAVISRLARRAGVTVGAVYSRWPTKSEVMVAALDHIFERLLPTERMKELNVAELPTTAILELWSAHLLSSDAIQDVLIQVFGSARNHPAVGERLRRFLNDQSDQLTHLIEKGKTEGPYSAELSTVAVTLMCQAIGIGTHLLISAGLDDRHIPTEEEWTELLRQVIGLVYPPTEQTT